MSVDERQDLSGMTQAELRLLMDSLGEPVYRARQLFGGIQNRRLDSFDLFTDLPKALRERLNTEAVPGSVGIGQVFYSSDGTRRFLLELSDGQEVETVFMPEEKRDTICISSQVGCPLACEFCVTGILGLKRNLTVGEIVSQMITSLNQVFGSGVSIERPTNIVIMGMGEPLLNYDNVMKAVRLLANPEGLGIPARRITLSTAGIVPRIYDLAKEPVRPKLAISLTAATDELRDRLFPINRKYSLGELMSACRDYPLGEREKLTFEYVMLDGVNDSKVDARRLVRLLSGLRCKVNLIPHNPAPELDYEATPMSRIIEFQEILKASDVDAFIRRPRGLDISAACGQLAARHSADPKTPESALLAQ